MKYRHKYKKKRFLFLKRPVTVKAFKFESSNFPRWFKKWGKNNGMWINVVPFNSCEKNGLYITDYYSGKSLFFAAEGAYIVWDKKHRQAIAYSSTTFEKNFDIIRK